MDILKRFEMMEYKAIATPMALNLKILSDISYHHVLLDFFPLMFLTYMRHAHFVA